MINGLIKSFLDCTQLIVLNSQNAHIKIAFRDKGKGRDETNK